MAIKLLAHRETEREIWNGIVQSCMEYEPFQLYEYVEAFAEQGEGEPLLFFYTEKEEKAVSVMFKRVISVNSTMEEPFRKQPYYDLISPYGYGGFVGNVSDWRGLVSDYQEICQQNGFVCEFVRFSLFSEYSRYYAGNVENITHNVIRTLDLQEDEMLMDFEHKVRKNLKKADKNGLQILIDESGQYLEDFLNIYYGTMKRTEAKSSFFFHKNFFEKMNEMQGHVVYFHVLYQNKIISTELVLYGNDNCYSYLGGTNAEYFECRPNEFLKYEIIKWAKKRGLKNFVLGGGYGQDDGIFKYKKSLAPNGVVDFYIGKNIFDEELYWKLTELKRGERVISRGTEGFFPAYREEH